MTTAANTCPCILIFFITGRKCRFCQWNCPFIMTKISDRERTWNSTSTTWLRLGVEIVLTFEIFLPQNNLWERQWQCHAIRSWNSSTSLFTDRSHPHRSKRRVDGFCPCWEDGSQSFLGKRDYKKEIIIEKLRVQANCQDDFHFRSHNKVYYFTPANARQFYTSRDTSIGERVKMFSTNRKRAKFHRMTSAG